MVFKVMIVEGVPLRATSLLVLVLLKLSKRGHFGIKAVHERPANSGVVKFANQSAWERGRKRKILKVVRRGRSLGLREWKASCTGAVWVQKTFCILS